MEGIAQASAALSVLTESTEPLQKASTSESGQLGTVPFVYPSDWELVLRMVAGAIYISSTALSLFLISLLAAGKKLEVFIHKLESEWATAVYILLAINAALFPLVAMVLIVRMTFEYVMREWIYYRLLTNHCLLDFVNRETPYSFARHSQVFWYITLSTLVLLFLIGLQPGALLAVGVLSAKLLAQIFTQRKLELRLLTVNKLVEDHPLKALDYVQRIVTEGRIVKEARVRLTFRTLKLVHFAEQDKRLTMADAPLELANLAPVPGADGRGKVHFALLAQELVKLKRGGAGRHALLPTDSGFDHFDAQELMPTDDEFERLNVENRKLQWPHRVFRHLMWPAEWATLQPELFESGRDAGFVFRMQFAFRLCMAGAVLIYVYGTFTVFALSQS